MPLTLLLVDDDSIDREAIGRALRAARVDASVVEAATAEEALAAMGAGTAPFDCVLLDFRLPDATGLEVLHRLRAAGSDIPVIALTGHGDEDTAVALMKAGAADYLSKTALTPDRLQSSIRHALAIAAGERERRLLLEREQAARKEAQEANRGKDEFLAVLSHELRTPLNTVFGWTRLLRETDPAQRDIWERGFQAIERNVALQIKLIEDLLDVSRIVTGKLVVDLQPLQLSAIVASVVESCRPSADAAEIIVQYSVEGEETPMVGDAARLQQVVTNLFSNALKFTPNGGRVNLRLKFTRDEIELTVTDTGAGIDPEFLPYVFERFRQGDAAAAHGRAGLGLGLAIVKYLVEAHGGRVAAESRGRGHGSTFRVCLPTAIAVTPALDPRTVAAATSAAAPGDCVRAAR